MWSEGIFVIPIMKWWVSLWARLKEMSGYPCEPDFEVSGYLCEPDFKVSGYLWACFWSEQVSVWARLKKKEREKNKRVSVCITKWAGICVSPILKRAGICVNPIVKWSGICDQPDHKVSWYLCKLYYKVSGYLCEPDGLVRSRFQRSTAKHYSKKSGLIYSPKKDA